MPPVKATPSQLNPVVTGQMTTQLKARRQAFIHRLLHAQPTEETAMNKTTLTRKKTPDHSSQPAAEGKQDQPDSQENTTMNAVAKTQEDPNQPTPSAEHQHESQPVTAKDPNQEQTSEPAAPPEVTQHIMQLALEHYQQASRPVERPKARTDTQKVAQMIPSYTARPRRLTLELPDSLHRDIKVYCAQNDLQVGLLVRSLLASCFENQKSA